MGRKVWKCSPKRCIILCYSLVGEPWHDTYQVYVHLHNFGSVALLSWSQRHHQCWQSLPSPLGVFPPCPWLRTPFQPSRSISPLWSGAATRAVFIFPQPCLATGLTQPWSQFILIPRRWLMVWILGWTWLQSLGLSLSIAGRLWGWALAIRLG